MLSILVPIYNFNVCQLVADLHQQCTACALEFEIIGFDDGSDNHYKQINRSIQDLKKVRYHELPQNLGRSKIRNELGKAAQFPYLLFMDCDSKVVRIDYIRQYAKHWREDCLVYGGRCYDTHPPDNPAHLLHWKFGIEREESTPETRSIKPWNSFMTNNFLIPKTLFLVIQFDESLIQYGHEDTLFGLELFQRKIAIVHIDNPLEHIGLETGLVFLDKTKKGIQNLHKLSLKGAMIHTKLLDTFKKIQSWKLKNLFALFFLLFENKLTQHLIGTKPRLFWFDIYKLGYLCHYSKNLQ